MLPCASLDSSGLWYAISSGALASELGYAIWYTALKGLRIASAAAVQLSVPVIAAVGGIVFLGEHPTARLLITSAAILGGIGLVIFDKRNAMLSEESYAMPAAQSHSGIRAPQVQRSGPPETDLSHRARKGLNHWSARFAPTGACKLWRSTQLCIVRDYA